MDKKPILRVSKRITMQERNENLLDITCYTCTKFLSSGWLLLLLEEYTLDKIIRLMRLLWLGGLSWLCGHDIWFHGAVLHGVCVLHKCPDWTSHLATRNYNPCDVSFLNVQIGHDIWFHGALLPGVCLAQMSRLDLTFGY